MMLIDDLEGVSILSPSYGSPVLLILEHLPSFLDETWNRVFSHSSISKI